MVRVQTPTRTSHARSVESKEQLYASVFEPGTKTACDTRAVWPFSTSSGAWRGASDTSSTVSFATYLPLGLRLGVFDAPPFFRALLLVEGVSRHLVRLGLVGVPDADEAVPAGGKKTRAVRTRGYAGHWRSVQDEAGKRLRLAIFVNARQTRCAVVRA